MESAMPEKLPPFNPPELPPGVAAMEDIARAQSARAVLEIDLAAIRHNLEVIRRLSPGARVMAVIKGDAYGLGAPSIGPVLESLGVPAFAVDSVAEGIKLRANGITKPVLVIDGDVVENAPLAVSYDLMPGIAQEELLLAYQRAAERRGKRQSVWLVANVGFNRSGYRDVERFTQFALLARECPNIEVRAVYAHMTNSNGDANISLEQVRAFEVVSARARAIFGPQLETSLFAAHGLVRWARSFPTDWVRPGILLYGEHAFIEDLLEPEAIEAVAQFRPAVRLRSRIVHLLNFDREEGVGYGQSHKTKAGQRLATVSFGFGSGYPAGVKRLHILVRGRRARLFGAAGMDALQIDVGNIPEAKLYDYVTLIGTEGDEHISVHDLARAADMSPYELLSNLRCHRVYVDSDNPAKTG